MGKGKFTKLVHQKLSKEELVELSKKRSIFPEFDYLNKATYIGIRAVDSIKCHLLKVGNTKLYYDISSGLKIKGSSLRNKETLNLCNTSILKIM